MGDAGEALVSPLARVSPGARLGAGCRIGDFTVVHDQVVLGQGSTVDSHCILGYPTPLAEGRALSIGAGSLIRSHSIVYAGSTFGPRLRTGHHAVLREGIVAGSDLQVGSFGDFQGHARIGDHVRTHSGVQVNHGSQVGDFVWLFPHVVLANDPHPPSDVQLGVVVQDYAAIGANACVLPGITVGSRSLVAAQSLVNRDVPPDTVVAGVPAKPLGPTSSIVHKGDGKPAYPWTRHFRRGYPLEVTQGWGEA